MNKKTEELQALIENTKKSKIFGVPKIYEIFEEIKNSNVLVIVEGKKDKTALQKLGINNVMELSRKPLFQIVEEVASANKECIILTDLDKKGKEIYGKLNSNLQRHGVKINNKLREFLFRHTKLRQIEGIDSYLEVSYL